MVSNDKIEIVAKNYCENERYLKSMQSLIEQIYTDGFKKGVEKAKQTEQWIFCKDQKPPRGENVQIMIIDDSGDNPYVYSTVGWNIDDYWIVDNDIACGDVVAWKHVSKPLSLQTIADKGYW